MSAQSGLIEAGGNSPYSQTARCWNSAVRSQLHPSITAAAP